MVRIEWGLRRRRQSQSISRLSLGICFGRPLRLVAGLVIRPPFSNPLDYFISLLMADEPEHWFQDFTLVIFSYIKYHDPTKFLPAQLRKAIYRPSKFGELEITKLVCNLFAQLLTTHPPPTTPVWSLIQFSIKSFSHSFENFFDRSLTQLFSHSNNHLMLSSISSCKFPV